MENYYNGVNLKSLSLILLAAQSLAYGLLLPYSRQGRSDGNVFFAPSGVLVMEALKVLIATAGLFFKHYQNLKQENEEYNYKSIPRQDLEAKENDALNEKNSLLADQEALRFDESSDNGKIDGRPGKPSYHHGPMISLEKLRDIIQHSLADVCNISAFRMAIPSVLYVIQNNLQMYSAGYLPPAEFQVFSQFKLVTTAFISVWLLKKILKRQHWLSIAVLCIGLIMVKGADEILKEGTESDVLPGLWSIGVPSILGACCFSGLAGVLIEMQLKGKKTCFWATNIQLALFSLVPALIPVLYDTLNRQKFEPLRYFDGLVWTTIIVNVTGGVLVSMVIKYADNILKNFAISVSMILTVIISSILSGNSVSVLQVLGSFLVAGSTIVYGRTPSTE